MTPELEFVFVGLAVCGVWCGGVLIFLAVWSGLHSIRTPKQKRDWNFKYTDTAPPVRSVMWIKKG